MPHDEEQVLMATYRALEAGSTGVVRLLALPYVLTGVDLVADRAGVS